MEPKANKKMKKRVWKTKIYIKQTNLYYILVLCFTKISELLLVFNTTYTFSVLAKLLITLKWILVNFVFLPSLK